MVVDAQDASPPQLQLEFKCFLIDHKTNKHVPVGHSALDYHRLILITISDALKVQGQGQLKVQGHGFRSKVKDDLRSGDKDLISKVKDDLRSEVKDLRSKVKDLRSEDKDLRSKDKDL